MKTSTYLLEPFCRFMYPFFFVVHFLTFGSIAMVSGQTIPRPPNCLDTPLHPKVGKEYSYSVSIASPYTTPQTFDWYVTDNPGFIAGSTLITTNILPNSKEYIDAGTGYHNTVTGTNTITIKWTGKAVINAKTKPYFLVIQYKGTNGTLCEAMNMRAYKIEPYNAFTLDITNMNGAIDLGLDGSNVAVIRRMCAKDILSASYDGMKMVYDYGVNELIYKVVATNFAGSWIPTVKISGLAGSQSIGSIEWSTTTTFSGTNLFTKNADSWTPGNKILAPADNLTEDGEIVYFKVLVQNNDYEGIIDSSIILSLNGVCEDGTEDVHYADCLPDGFSNDFTTQQIMARPVITSNTGSPAHSFLP